MFVTRDRDKTQHIRDLYEKFEPDHVVFLDDRIHMGEDDFGFPITILDMDRNGGKKGNYVVHRLEEVRPFLQVAKQNEQRNN